MRKTILFVCFWAIAQFSFGQNIVQFKVSKPYCVFNFLEAATNQQGTSSTLRAFITSKTKGDAGFQQLRSDFSNIQLDYSYKREEFPENRRQHRSTQDLINIALVNANTFEEFKSKTIGILPHAEQQKLIALLKKAEPYYDNLIWNSNEQKIKNQQLALEIYASRASDLFVTFRHFYNSSWTTDVPFIVALYPIPGARGNSTASPHANSLCVGVLTDETAHIERMGVVLHEMCHVLYDEQTKEFQHEIERWFGNHRSPYTQYAYNFFDEALATALGNGWAYQTIRGRMDTTDWYNNEYINGYAKALYPLVEQYLGDHRQIDSSFVVQAIGLFAKTFPSAIADYGILLNRVSIYSDAETEAERGEVFNAIGSEFQLTNTGFSSPILDPGSLELLRNGEHTQLIIVDRNFKENTAALKKIFPQLKTMGSADPASKTILSFYDKSDRPIIILYAPHKEDVTELLKKMRHLKYFDLKNIVQK